MTHKRRGKQAERYKSLTVEQRYNKLLCALKEIVQVEKDFCFECGSRIDSNVIAGEALLEVGEISDTTMKKIKNEIF